MEYRWNTITLIEALFHTCLNPYFNGIPLEFNCDGYRDFLFCLNPYFNGIPLEQALALFTPKRTRLNPYFNGIPLEHTHSRCRSCQWFVLILILMEYSWNSPVYYRFMYLYFFSIFLISHILNDLHLLYPFFRKCLLFLMSNPGI